MNVQRVGSVVFVDGNIPVIAGSTTVCLECGKKIQYGQTSNRKWIPFNLDRSNSYHWSTCKQRIEIIDEVIEAIDTQQFQLG